MTTFMEKKYIYIHSKGLKVEILKPYQMLVMIRTNDDVKDQFSDNLFAHFTVMHTFFLQNKSSFEIQLSNSNKIKTTDPSSIFFIKTRK